MNRIDINADMGESFGNWKLGNDEELIKHVSSANIACGFHAGDWDVMRRSVDLALEYKVAVGAHPSYPDLHGFGRRHLDMAAAQLVNVILYQLGALGAITRAAGTEIVHVKPHGALYHDAMKSIETAEAVAKAIKLFARDLTVYCLPNSCLEKAAGAAGLFPCTEGFGDRSYEPNGSLTDRRISGSVLKMEDAVAQSLDLVNGSIRARDGSTIQLTVETICIHGDSPGAPSTARAVREAFAERGVVVAAPRDRV